MNLITSISNQQIKNIIKLQNKSKERNEQGVFVIEGIKLFEEAKAQCRQRIVKAYISDVLFYKISEECLDYFEDIPYEIVMHHIFTEAAQTISPQGILAVMKQPSYKLDDMLMNEQVNLLILEDLRDPGNLGTIIRTAEGAGFSGIIMNKGCVDIYNPKVIRSTMGSILRVPYIYTDDLIKTIKELKERKIRILAAHIDGAVDYTEAVYTNKNAILIGNEANGISSETAKECDVKLRIPMKGKVESLNAAVAAALFMYEAARIPCHEYTS